MNRRQFLSTAVAGTLIRATETPPNIVFILADDLGYGDLGCFGQQKIRTPNIDRLAASGMRFTRHYSGSPVCAPSRCVLMTGLHPGHSAIRDNKEIQPEGQASLPAGTETLARALRKVGYRTGCFGKWGLGAPGSPGEPLRQGFDRFFGYNCQRHAHNYYRRTCGITTSAVHSTIQNFRLISVYPSIWIPTIPPVTSSTRGDNIPQT